MEPISIVPQLQAEPVINVGIPTVSPATSPETAEDRSTKAEYSLHDYLRKTKDQIYGGLLEGQELPMRQEVAAAIDQRKQEATQRIIEDFAKTRQGPLTPEEAGVLRGIITDMTIKTDPETVFEEAYAKALVANLDKVGANNPSSFLRLAQQEMPEQVAKEMRLGNELATKQQILLTKEQNAKDLIKTQTMPGYLYDQVKYFFPGYMDAQGRGNVQGVGAFSGVLLGQNEERQAEALWKLPVPEFKKEVDRIYNEKSSGNPTEAARWLGAMRSMSSSQRMMDNFFPPLDYVGIGLGTGSVKLARKVGLMSSTRQAVKDTLKTSVENPTRSEMIANAGDLKAAATIKSTVNMTETLTGAANVEKQSLDSLVTTFRTDLQDFAENPGRGGQEIVNRLSENTNWLIDEARSRFLETNKVERLYGVLDNEERAKKVIDATVENYPGHRNRVLGTSQIFKDRVTTASHVDIYIGDEGAEYFFTKGQAEGYAQTHGLNYPIESKSIPVPEGEFYYVPKAAIKRGWETADRVGEIEVTKGKPVLKTDDGAFVDLHRQPSKGLIPMQVRPDGSLKFFPEIKVDVTQRYYMPQAAFKREWETKPRLGEITVKNGVPTIKTDDGSVVELSRTAKEGYVPFEVKPNGDVDFLPIGTPEVTIHQQGLGWYIKRTVPIDETNPVIRDAIGDLLNEEGSVLRGRENLLSGFVGKLMTPENVLSRAQRDNRKAATYGPARLMELATGVAKEIQGLTGWKNLTKKQRWNDWQTVVRNAQDIPDPVTGKPGSFFRTGQDLDDYYLTHIKRLPDDQEKAAYFAFKQLVELDRQSRILAELRNQLRLGNETVKFSTIGKDGKRVFSDEFSGVELKGLPNSDDNILFVGKKMGTEFIEQADTIQGTKLAKDTEKAIKEGRMRIFEVHRVEPRPFKNFGNQIKDTRIRYVVAENMESRALDWNQVPRTGGGHLEYDYANYIKQARVVKEQIPGTDRFKYIYESDTTIMPIKIGVMGKDVADKLDRVRQLLREEKVAEAEDYATNVAKLPFKWDTLHGWFKAGRDEKGFTTPPRLSLDDKIQVVPSGKQIVDMSDALEKQYKIKGSFKDGTKSGSLAKQFQVQFTGERDAFEVHTLKNVGTQYNPLYNVEPAAKIDPMSSINRSLTRIIHSNFMDDYKIFSVETWLAEASKYLKTSKADIMHSPFWHFNNALTDFRTGTPPEIKHRLEAAHLQIRMLIGIPSKADAMVHTVSQKLQDSLYTGLGPKTALLPSLDALGRTQDPFTFMRSVVFHTKLGMFNLPQFIVQSMSYTNIYGIAGSKYATPGMMGAQLHFWSRVNKNPAILDKLDDIASRMNLPGTSRWKPGEFKEAMKELEKTGFGYVAGEHSLLDDVFNNKVVMGAGSQILESGTMFFRGGERNARYGAWYTAYREWRDKNPTAIITDQARKDILDRADLLNVNMSRASSSMLHSGIASIPMQFFTYQLRLMELMWSKRLTNTERARLFATNAMLYGLPISTGLTGFPFADHIKQYALENGYSVGDNFFTSLAMEGLPAMLGAIISGGGDYSRGEFLNFGDRYGNKGFDPLNSLIRGDKTAWEIFGGASFSVLKEFWEQSDGFRMAMMSGIRDDDQFFKVTQDDVVDIMKVFSSANTATKMIVALNTGKWISKKETYLTDVSPVKAMIMGFSGLQDQKLSDLNRMSWSIKDQKELEKKAQEQFIQEFRRGLNDQNDNPEQARTYLGRAFAILRITGYPEDKIPALISMAARDNETLVQRIDWQFYMKGPERTRELRQKAYERQKIMEDQKKQ